MCHLTSDLVVTNSCKAFCLLGFSFVKAFIGAHSGTVVKVLCYKSGGRWFDSRWCNWNFLLT